jgi:hypothetical protein
MSVKACSWFEHAPLYSCDLESAGAYLEKVSVPAFIKGIKEFCQERDFVYYGQYVRGIDDTLLQSNSIQRLQSRRQGLQHSAWYANAMLTLLAWREVITV